MTQTYRCGDYAALMGYLYDDCEPEEREAIATHLQSCRPCATELEVLTGTRRQLASWAPPDTRLGFQITPTADESRVIPFGSAKPASAAWWRQPLPAWAQLAAALVIFAAGLSIGTARGATVESPAVGASPEVRAQLIDLRRRVNNVERFAKQGADRVTVAHALPNEADLLQRIDYQIARSEERQRQERREELAYRLLEMVDTTQSQVQQVEANVAKANNELGNRLLQVAYRVDPK